MLRLLARGLTTREMSAALFISPKTVSHHIENIYTKIGVTNRARASLFAVTHGLMSATRTWGEHPTRPARAGEHRHRVPPPA